MSLDVLVFVEDKAAAGREVVHLMRPGGRFGFSAWEQPGYTGRVGSTPVGHALVSGKAVE